MMLNVLFLLSVFVTINSIAEIEWECGTDDFTKYISESQIEYDCPLHKNVINNCCIEHDSCYDDQKGRTFCDDTFCDCLQNVTLGHKMCHEEDAPLFCDLVRDFGADAYRLAGNNSLTDDDDTTFASLTQNTNLLSGNDTVDYDYEQIVRSNDTVRSTTPCSTSTAATATSTVPMKINSRPIIKPRIVPIVQQQERR